MMSFDPEAITKELTYKATMSGGPGGQHANRASTKVVLEWALNETSVLSEAECKRLQEKLASYITKNEVLQLSCEETRSQHKNKAIVTARLLHLIKTGLQRPKKRKDPKPGKKFHKKRLNQKKHQAEKKENRKKNFD